MRAPAARLLLLPLIALVLGSAPAISRPAPRSVQAAPAAVDRLQEDAYIIGPGDGLNINFLFESSLSGGVGVLNDGTASLPLLGSVRLTGLTLSQAGLWLQSLYRRQLLRPDLQITVSAPRPVRVAVVGEVRRVGIYSLTTASALVDAIRSAGGLTVLSDLRQVELQRRLPGERPTFKRTRVNLMALMRDGDQLQNPLLFDGDTIRVLKAETSGEEDIEVASSTLAPESIAVNIIGELRGGGRISLPPNTPLLQGILAAGGPVPWRANTGNVELIRINRNGTATRERFKIDYGQGVSISKNPPLRDGDTVIVHRSPLAKASDALTALTTPLSGFLNAWATLDIISGRN